MKLICMAFDGDYKTESPSFKSIDETWEHSNDIGSRWYFYPFHFVVSESGKTIVDAPSPLDYLIGKRVKTVARLFEQKAALPEAQNMDVDNFVWFIAA